jgi:hypothetical protein
VARTLHQLTVFVSGPGGVDAEKAAVRVAVEEINRRSEKTHAVTLRVVAWPDDVRPGVNVDPQSEINQQIESFDIYMGIIGSRFGTPTGRSGSGTEEEFEGALAKFTSDSTSVRLLFYFRRGATDPFSIDPVQLQKVQEFRQGLGSRGVLYRDFQDTSDFSKQVREHLDGLIIDEWQGDKWLQTIPAVPPREPESYLQVAMPVGTTAQLDETSDQDDDEELGLFEYMAAFQQSSDAIVGVMGAILQDTSRVAEEIRSRTDESERINVELGKHTGVGGSRAQQQFLIQATEVVDHAARDLDYYTMAMTPNVEQFRALIRAMFDNMRRAFRAGRELGPRDHASDRQALVDLIPVLRRSTEQLMSFQTSITRVPALTGRFKRSRRRAAAILGKMVAEMSFAIQEAAALLEEMGGPPEAKIVDFPAPSDASRS